MEELQVFIVKVIGKKKQKTIKKQDVRSESYRERLIESLKDHDHAVAYLNVAIEECLKGDSESQKLLLNALKNVAEAQGNISSLAKRSSMRRESIYRMLSDDGNPYLQSFTSLIHAMGFGIKLY